MVTETLSDILESVELTDGVGEGEGGSVRWRLFVFVCGGLRGEPVTFRLRAFLPMAEVASLFALSP